MNIRRLAWVVLFFLIIYPSEALAVSTTEAPKAEVTSETSTFSLPEIDPATTLADINIGKSHEDEINEANALRAATEQAREAESERVAAQQAASRQYTAPSPSPSLLDIQQKAKSLITQRWGEGEWSSFNLLVMSESGWNPNALNPSSGACGLAQALPCSKLGSMDIDNQINWMINYIAERYGTPSNAWYFHIKNNWY